MRRGPRPHKLLAASAARVAPGGESGWFQWLVPGLVVTVVLFAALTVRSDADRASRATTTSARAQAFVAAVRESVALETAVRASHGTNKQIKAQAAVSRSRMLSALDPVVRAAGSDPAVASLAQRARAARTVTDLNGLQTAADSLSKRFEDDAKTASDRSHQRLTLTLIGSAALAALMLWSFFSKRARVTLERSERRFRSLVEHSTELLAVVDEKQRIKFVTPAFGRRLGYEGDELLGTCLLEHVHRDDREQAEGEGPHRWRVRHRDGSWIETEVDSKDLRDDPAVHGYVVTVRDIGHQ